MSKKQKNKRSKKWIFIAGAVVIVGAAAVLGRGLASSTPGAAQASDSQTAKAELGSIEVVKEGNGTVEVKDSRQITMIHDSKILSIEKENGDTVAEGDVIATVESNELDDSISQLESDISELDSQISSKDSSGDAYISSKVTGRVKVINIESGDSVKNAMQEHGALMEIASDGKLKIAVSAESDLAVNSKVTVKFSDYSEEGTVISNENGLLTVTISDGYNYELGQKAAVYNEEEQLVGEGDLEINTPYYVTGDYGTVDSIRIKLNDKVYDGTTLIRLKNTKNYPGYTDLIDKRNKKIEELWELREYRDSMAITAPCAGIISNLEVTAGTALLKDSEFCDILDNSVYLLKAEIDELDIDGVKEGQKAAIVFDAFEDVEYEGTVTKVSNIGNNTNGVTTYTVTIDIEGTDRMKSNMSATAKIVTDSKEQTLLVPVDAIQTVDGQKCVDVISGSGETQTTETKQVTLGLVNSTHAEILEGLEEGQAVAVVSTDNSDMIFQMGMGGMGNDSDNNDSQAAME